MKFRWPETTGQKRIKDMDRAIATIREQRLAEYAKIKDENAQAEELIKFSGPEAEILVGIYKRLGEILLMHKGIY